MNTEKMCTRCFEWKGRSGFYAKADSSDGLRSECRLCHKEMKATGEIPIDASPKKDKVKYPEIKGKGNRRKIVPGEPLFNSLEDHARHVILTISKKCHGLKIYKDIDVPGLVQFWKQSFRSKSVTCPITGHTLLFGRATQLSYHPAHLPTLMRIDPIKGYTWDNVQTVSHLGRMELLEVNQSEISDVFGPLNGWGRTNASRG